MKNLYFTLVFISLITSAQAQKINFTDSGNAWYVLIGKEMASQGHITGYFHENYLNGGDTVINSKAYTNFCWYNKSTGATPYAWVRYDSNARKVYIADSNTELVLYDYNLSVGDTFYAPKISSPLSQVWHVVDSVDSIQINGTFHKTFYLKVGDANLYINEYARDYTIIEGIGCSAGPLYPLYGTAGITAYNERSRGVICFKNNGIAPPIYTNCKDTALSIYNSEISDKPLSVYPQPATSVVNIQLPITIQSGSVKVYNQLGQEVISNTIANKELLEINNPGPLHGLYYYRITDNTENRIYSGKLIFE